ncbi:MAG: PIN domain-containing protein [Planctomycetaceae bacterium]|jgi:predicted nucleic acid-binding protein|nr:PIN domain-containing protein [Planctomycetaceae bacterium]
MKVLIDTNIILDVLLNRQPYCRNAAKIVVLSEKEIIESYISASAITDIYYITQKMYKDKQKTIDLIKKILEVVSIATITGNNIYQALDLEWNDFEDSVQYIVGESVSADYIVIRNVNDFNNSTIKIVTPEQFIDIISEE